MGILSNSTFADTGVADTGQTLASLHLEGAATLTSNINDTVSDEIELSTAFGLDPPGVIAIDDEVILYHSVYYGKIRDCVRGAFGTTAANHTAGALVHIFNRPFAHNPAIAKGVIACQEVLITRHQVVAFTADDGPVAADSGKTMTNEGATGTVTLTLPACAAGLIYTFIVMAAFDFVLQAQSGDVIHFHSGTSTAGGTATSAVVGASITLKAVNATDWMLVAHSDYRDWTLA